MSPSLSILMSRCLSAGGIVAAGTRSTASNPVVKAIDDRGLITPLTRVVVTLSRSLPSQVGGRTCVPPRARKKQNTVREILHLIQYYSARRWLLAVVVGGWAHKIVTLISEDRNLMETQNISCLPAANTSRVNKAAASWTVVLRLSRALYWTLLSSRHFYKMPCFRPVF
jgi:hypothetical protein